MSRKAYWVKLLQDLIGPTHQWPQKIRMWLLRTTHPNNMQRFGMTVFLLKNGTDPELIKEFYTDLFDFDREAWRQINWIIGKYPTSNWTSWNVYANRSM